jgi:hypothetical protein
MNRTVCRMMIAFTIAATIVLIAHHLGWSVPITVE